MNFETHELVTLLGNMYAGHITYEIGSGKGKVRDLAGTEPSEIESLDCSGFIQYVIYRTTFPSIKLIGGTTMQRQRLEDEGYARSDYLSDAVNTDDQVRIGFRRAVREEGVRKKVGHVWLVINGVTYESTTKHGNNGPSSFSWSERTNEVTDFFLLGSAPDFERIKAGFPWDF